MFWTSVAHAMGQVPQGAEGGTQNQLMSFLPLVLMFVVFYFLLIRPQQKKQKQLRDLINNLKRGDRVISGGGIYGRVESLDNDKVNVEIAPNVVITVARAYIAGLADPKAEPKAAPKKNGKKDDKKEDTPEAKK